MLHYHDDQVNCVCISNDNKMAASAGEDKTIILYDF